MNLLPLSDFQYSIWKGQKMYPESPLYNMVFTFDLHGKIDRDKFFEAFGLLVKQTSSFNLVVDESDNDRPHQRIAELTPQLEFIDLSDNLTFDFESWMQEKNQLNFNLELGSYYSALIKKSDDHYIWYLNQHHIFTDAYCFQLIFNQFSEIYQSLLSGVILDLASDRESYIESCRERVKVETSAHAGKGKIQRDPLTLYGRKLADHGSTESLRQEFALDDALLAQIPPMLSALGLRTLAYNLDLLTFIMSSLIITLRKVGENSESRLLSNIFSQRFTKKNKTLVKPLLDILNSKIEWKQSDGYADLHQKIYAFLIMRKSEMEGSDQLLPSTIVNFFDLRFEQFAGIDVDYIWHHCGHMDSHHCLRFHIFRYTADDKYTFAFDVKGRAESQLLGDRLAGDFTKVVTALVSENAEVEKICLLSESELNALNNKGKAVSALSVSEQESFVNVLRRKVGEQPEAIALRESGQTLTYQELMDRASVIASKIQAITNKTNNKVVIYLPRSQDFVIAVMGSLIQGSSFIPVPHGFPVERVKYIVSDVGADLLIYGEKEVNVAIPSLNVHMIDYSNMSSGMVFDQIGEDFYTLYTSGSTGKPKGVPITQHSFSSYLAAAAPLYLQDEKSYHMPLFTSVGFDLTMTSLFLPLYTGGSISIYPEKEGIDISIREVINNDILNCFKCTPSHLKLVRGLAISEQIQSVLVGGENFTRQAVSALYEQSGQHLEIFNEYGPTECSVGCIVHRFDPTTYLNLADMPIGRPMVDAMAFIADENGMPLPQGVIGELCLVSPGLSKGYLNDKDLSQAKYITDNPFVTSRYYRTGDYARRNVDDVFEYFGRRDSQLKVQGIRIESGEIENVIEAQEAVTSCIVTKSNPLQEVTNEYIHCSKCGLPSNYPTADFDDDNVCGFCRNYESYEKKVEKYFETEERFSEIFAATKPHDGEYDCMMLFSGGKDSSYALGKLAALGLKVLAFTLDNGYISDNAKENITRITRVLGVDHVFGSTPHMNEIFVDSLKTHCNVCNGCFKTIYNISLKIAFEKKIPIVVTGLSRGQFFETKLSEEIFWKPMEDVAEIDKTLFAARQAYHGVQDVAYLRTDGAFIEENDVLKSVKIVDFYRYHDVTLEELYNYIGTQLPWIRPDDTGRSTNCLINKVGIYVHRQERGYSNYAFPYSWDVRTGHKTKEETIDEVEEVITESDVRQIIEEIGYQSEVAEGHLVAYYTGMTTDSSLLRKEAANHLPDYMIPSQFIHVDQIPMTTNGKVDYKKLQEVKFARTEPIRKPTNELEELLLEIYQEVMLLDEISIDDNYFEIGGTSLHAIRIVARLEKTLDYTLGVHQIFQLPSIELLSQYILSDMQSILESDTT